MARPYHPMPPAKSCAQAWLAAAQFLLAHGPVNTLILHIEDSIHHSDADHAVITEVDTFLRGHGVYPIATVANTIFPQSLYHPGSPEKLYARYRRSFRNVKKLAPDWGRYFDRMIRWPRSDGDDQNQLKQLIKNIKKYGPQSDRPQPYYNMFEMTLFHPEKDADKPLGRQCLSFIEIKPEKTADGAVLHMTALYRSHYYVARTLGNLIGLGRLLNFVAAESGYKPGSLSIHSTHAELDTGSAKAAKGQTAWGKTATRDLIGRCTALMQPGTLPSADQAVEVL